MNISIATDFNGSTGSPRDSLKAISEAGFTHLHWCHQWCTDFLYSKHEIAQIKAWLKEFNLKLLDIHGSQGAEKLWYADEEYRRKSGVELVANRIEMLRELEGEGALMMHIPCFQLRTSEEDRPLVYRMTDNLRRSLDELIPVMEKNNVMITIENMWTDNFEIIRTLLGEYSPDHLGLCYDSGHANDPRLNGMDHLDTLRDRLKTLHLHDNNGTGDQHQPPFYGNVNWERLAEIIANSAYNAPVSFEMAMCNTPFFDKEHQGPQDAEHVKAFLKDAYERCGKFCKMVENAERA